MKEPTKINPNFRHKKTSVGGGFFEKFHATSVAWKKNYVQRVRLPAQALVRRQELVVNFPILTPRGEYFNQFASGALVNKFDQLLKYWQSAANIFIPKEDEMGAVNSIATVWRLRQTEPSELASDKLNLVGFEETTKGVSICTILSACGEDTDIRFAVWAGYT